MGGPSNNIDKLGGDHNRSGDPVEMTRLDEDPMPEILALGFYSLVFTVPKIERGV